MSGNTVGPFTLGKQIGGSDQWLRRWTVMLAAKASTSGPGVGATPGQIAAGPGGDTTGFLPTQQIEAGTGFALTSDDNPAAGSFDSSGLRIKFNVRQANSNTPNTADIWIYNLADQTASDLINEFNYIVLQAGYLTGNFGVIFAGEIKQYKRGHESAVDGYLRILAADGDRAVNEAIVNTTLPPGTTSEQKNQTLIETMQPLGVKKGYVDPSAVIIPPNIRSDVLVGPAADRLRDYAASPTKDGGAVWSIENGQFNLTKPTGYDPGEIVKLNSQSGLIGWPEMTQDGFSVTCLINPSIRLRQRIQLDNSQINQYFTPGGVSGTPTGSMLGWTDLQFFSPIAQDGIYTPWVIDYEGDSHGEPWYQHMVCLAVKSEQASDSAVPGGQDSGSASV